MFEWLDKEVQAIRTSRFHIFTGEVVVNELCISEYNKLTLPKSYTTFISRYGGAKLYHRGNYYIVGVLPAPVEDLVSTGETYYRIGHSQEHQAYFRADALCGQNESPVFEGKQRHLTAVAGGFEAWLQKSCAMARRGFTAKEWEGILAGPAPFTQNELSIVEARRNFTWKVIGISTGNRMLFQVRNGSDRVLPYLSIGLRWKDGSLNGGLSLPVHHIEPGTTEIVEQAIYDGRVDAHDVEAMELPDPEPQDRGRYWEFKRSNPG